MEINDRNAVKSRLSTARNALAFASTHLRNVMEKPSRDSISSRRPANTVQGCLAAQGRIDEARRQIEELTALLVPLPPSYDSQADVFRRAIENNIFAG